MKNLVCPRISRFQDGDINKQDGDVNKPYGDQKTEIEEINKIVKHTYFSYSFFIIDSKLLSYTVQNIQIPLYME